MFPFKNDHRSFVIGWLEPFHPEKIYLFGDYASQEADE